jgi:hypothetical protein
MPNHRKRNQLTIEEHQMNEMVNAIQQVVSIENVKARKDVIKIITEGVEAGTNPADILCNVLDWCGNE